MSDITYTRITEHGEEKCSLRNGDGMTIEEKYDAIAEYCKNRGMCKDAPICPLINCGCNDDRRIDNNYNILVNAGLIKPPVNFVKANTDDEVKQADDAINSGLADSGTRYEKHRAICDKLNDTYRKKNTDYGNSFAIGFTEYGLVMPVIRLEDKFRRFKRLALGGEQNVENESIKDTLLDLANYAIMTLVEMEEYE